MGLLYPRLGGRMAATSTKALTADGAKVTTVANGHDATAAPPPASTLSNPPHAAVYPAGQCVFGEDWSAATLVAKERCKETTVILTFELPDTSKPLGLSTCACILAKFDRDGAAVVRPYTPISTNAMIGRFELLVKIYAQGQCRSISTDSKLAPVSSSNISRSM